MDEFKKIAHDLRSPISLLRALVEGEADADKMKQMIQLVVDRLNEMADSLDARGEESSHTSKDSSDT